MAMPFGVSFLPSGDSEYTREGGRPGGMTPAQQAIQILSMRVPRIVGQNPLAPLALMTGQGSQGIPPGLLERLLQQQVPSANQPTAPPLAQMPAPQAAPAAPPTLPAPVPTPQVPPPPAPTMRPTAPPVMAQRPAPQPAPAPRPGPVVSGAPSPSAPPPPQLPQAPPSGTGKPKIDFERTGYNPEPPPPPPPRDDITQRGDVVLPEGLMPPAEGISPLAWAQAQLLRRRMYS